MQDNNDIIISFYKDPKTGFSINNTFRNLLKTGHKFTLRQVQEAIKDLDEYYKSNIQRAETFILKTVTDLMTTYQADTFFLKQHSKSKVKFVALINVVTRKCYAYLCQI